MGNQEEPTEKQRINAKMQVKEKRRKYYENNKYDICNKTINIYCIGKIEKIRNLHSEKVNEYMNRYPFEECADGYIKKQLRIHKIYSSHSHYDDCYDAGIMAYLYSIHRCAEMSYSYTEFYMKKLIRIYIICALVICNDTKNLCQINGFREIRLDADASLSKY